MNADLRVNEDEDDVECNVILVDKEVPPILHLVDILVIFCRGKRRVIGFGHALLINRC